MPVLQCEAPGLLVVISAGHLARRLFSLDVVHLARVIEGACDIQLLDILAMDLEKVMESRVYGSSIGMPQEALQGGYRLIEETAEMAMHGLQVFLLEPVEEVLKLGSRHAPAYDSVGERSLLAILEML